MKRRWVWLVLLAAAVALAVPFALGSGSASSSSGCMFVNGHLLDEQVTGDPSPGTVGRMVGSISGEYHFFESEAFGPYYDPPVAVDDGNATIVTSEGELYWHEDSLLDQWNVDDYSTAVLARITGGTGTWAGAKGHVIMSGYFDISTMSGQFDYRGIICWDG